MPEVQNEGIGKLSDSYPDRSLITCHKIDPTCRTEGEYSCDECRFGFFESVGNKRCLGGGVKFCNPNKCGEKGWPACLRGLQFSTSSKLPVGCQEGSINGYCKKGLNTFCDSDGVLVCL